MKRLIVALSSCAFVLTVCFLLYFMPQKEAASALPDNDMLIIIDAGHGGMDGGTSAADGTLEKHINLQISQKLNNALISCGFKTLMLRTDDELIGDNSLSTIRARKVSDIKTRLAVAESHPDSLLISIHQNYYQVSKYTGTQVFYSPNSPESRELAECLQRSVVETLQKDNIRKVKAVGSNIYLLYNCTIPSVMVECGFLSNPNEAQLLKTDSYQMDLVFSLMKGILEFLE